VSGHLIVYGTLQSGYPTFDRLGLGDAVRMVGRCRFRGTMRDLGAYPGVVLDGGRVCEGDLVEVLDDRAWPVLDRFEGAEYRRVLITCDEPHDTDAWIYEMVTPAGTVVPSGRWP
jgi:gamma-glutamylcyclotransferase (GGCT)/AIG2-like uncharacterized protein YtfP